MSASFPIILPLSSLLPSQILGLGIFSTFVVVVCRISFFRLPLPPGPRHSSRWGSYYDRPPSVEPWKKYKEWARSYASPLIYYKVRGRQVIVINKFQTALDLLERRSLNFSSRPDLPMVDLIGRQDNVGFQRYGPRLRKCRKLLHDALNVHSIVNWGGLVEDESTSLLEELLSSPNDVAGPAQRYIAALIVRFTYGHRPNRDYLHLAEETAQDLSVAMVPGRWLIDSFPFLRYFPAWAPGGGFQTWAAEARRTFRRFIQVPFEQAKREMNNGSMISSFVHDNLDALGPRSDDAEEIISNTAASLYSAATDTTSSVLLTFFLMMTVNSEIQEKAFQEISSVVGNDRLPGLQDRHSLPYIEAILQELHRFNPAIPLMPRSPERDDVYEGMRIPRKTWVLTNIWAMTHDEDEYENPGLFNPDRFIVDAENVRDPRDMTFGFGRRACPGSHFANAAIYLAIARILAVFRLEPVKDANGNTLLPDVEFVTALTPAPKPFKCLAVLRSPTSGDLIKLLRMSSEDA